MPSSQPRAGESIRILAFAVLALFALTAALLCLWIAFPRWGMDPGRIYSVDAIIYIPPQGFAAGFTLVLAAFLGEVVCLVALILALARRQAAWGLTFAGLMAVSVLAPIIIATGNAHSISVSLTAQALNAIIFASAVAFLAMPVLALVYARRHSAPPNSCPV
jgi:hypothetical protein